MATELKIHLSTYLKDAGIKATEAQVEQLAAKVKKVNTEMRSGANASSGAFVSLRGPLGAVQRMLGGVAAQVLSVAAAFKVGWDIGNLIQEKVIRPLFGIQDPIEQLKKENRELARQAKEAASAWDEAFKQWKDGFSDQARSMSRARQEAEDLTAAYEKMANAIDKVKSTEDDSEMLDLKKQKAEDIMRIIRPDAFAANDRGLKLGEVHGIKEVYGTQEQQAAQVEKLYDVRIAELKQRQELAKFDREAERMARRQSDAEAARADAVALVSAKKRELADIEKKQRELDRQDESVWGIEKTAERDKQLAEDRARIEDELYNAQRSMRLHTAERDAIAVEMSSQDLARKNIKSRTDLEIVERKKAYDEYVFKMAEEDKKARDDDDAQRTADTKARLSAEEQERKRIQRELNQQEIADMRNKLSIAQQMNAQARSDSSAADSALSRAWGWYRDKNSMQSAIDEYKAQKESETQWEKDFASLKFRRKDWRTVEFGKLSASDEAVRQVALAKEEKAAADRAIIETAENTRHFAEKLDELLQVKGA